jgi:hypothetical protein
MSPAIGHRPSCDISLDTVDWRLGHVERLMRSYGTLQQQQEEAFRTHDAHLMAIPFTDDADLA